MIPMPVVHRQDKPTRLTFEKTSINRSQQGERGDGRRAQPGGQP
jgi:hypothetical protein